VKPEREGQLRLLSAGAAQGLVASVAEKFRADTGLRIEGTFGAVGAIRERIVAGEPCDVVILTAPLIAALEASGHVRPATAAPLGHVRTGIAVRAGAPLPRISDKAELSKTLVDAAGLYFPDPKLATAGVHFMKVLRELGIADQVALRLHAYPNGATAMRALADTTASGLVGCTQITEIKYTSGVTLVGALPAGFELSTLYAVAVGNAAQERDAAREFASRLTAPPTRALRENAGFE
jgi:molybdate transport system substrate-binding protein